MATMTLVELKKRVQNKLISGIAEEITTTNPMYSYLPWTSFSGPGVVVNKETALGDADFYGIGDTITSKAASVVTSVLFEPTSIIGDAELNNLQVAMSSNSENEITSMEIASKAKSVGRKIQGGIATGTGTAPQYNSLHSLVDSGQYVTGGALTWEMLDELISKVKSKDGQVDFLMAHNRDIRAIRAMYRQLGGVPMVEVQMGNRSIEVVEFNGVPIFTNDYLSVAETAGGAALTGGALSSIWAGNWDDGTNKVGNACIYPEAVPAGITFDAIGEMETRDEKIYRVKSYSNFACFNKLGLARLTDLDGTIA
jgi:hypothetical protein